MRSIHRLFHSAAVLVAATLISLAACSTDLPTAPHVPHVARVVVRPMNDTVLVGQQREYFAVALDAAGLPLANTKFTWSASHPRVASIVAASPTDSAHATGDSVGVTRIVATADGVESDSAILVVIPRPVDNDTAGTVIDCNGVHERVYGWIVDVTFSYAFSVSGLDAFNNEQASFSMKYGGEVVVKLSQNEVLPDSPGVTWWKEEASPLVDGHLTADAEETQVDPGGPASEVQHGDGKPLADPAVNLGSLFVDTTPNHCGYLFSLSTGLIAMSTYTSPLDAPSTTTDTIFPATMGSVFLPIAQAGSSTGPLTLSGSADFRAGLNVNIDVFDPPPSVLGWYGVPGWPANDILWSTLATDDQFGTAKVSWRITAIR